MHIIPLPALIDNYIWLLIDETLGSAIAVDPGEASPVLEYLQSMQLNLNAILLTHHHYDHIGGTEELRKAYPQVCVYGPKDDRIPYPLISVNHFSIASWAFNSIAIPGHTATHIAFYEHQQQLLFCGDTLFSAGCGRVFDGSLGQLFQSLETIKQLPETTKIYCGHEYTRQNLRFALTVEPHNPDVIGYVQKLAQSETCSLPTTLALEKKVNPFLRTDIESVRLYVRQRSGDTSDCLSIFKQLREDKNNFR